MELLVRVAHDLWSRNLINIIIMRQRTEEVKVKAGVEGEQSLRNNRENQSTTGNLPGG